MTKNKSIFSIIKPQNMTICGIFVILTALLSSTVDAAVVSRSKGNSTTKTTQRVSRAQTASKTKTTTENKPAPTEKTIETETVATPEETVIEEIVEEEIIENKSNQFDNVLSDATTGDTDNSRNALADEIRAQRAKLDAADAASTAKNATLNALASGKSSCDQNLRACMQSKCGNDFSKCAGDTDTAWGTKMDACRRDLNCTGEEYRLFATEIKADRDMNARVASYNAIVDCGNRYNDCIIGECGTKFTKCLGKKDGDTAISKCEKIAKSCTEQDSGLSQRVMNVFGTLRLGAEEKVSTDQERLYAMRDAMRDTCKRLGAMFDDRTLDCVYTINFFAGEDNTLYASKKAYAGTTFNCHQNWFGIDLTTFKENAFRLTRAQTSASSAMLGAGLGTAVGAVTSGALERSIERQEAEQRAKNGGKTDAELRKEKREEKKVERQAERDAKKAERQEERDAKKAERQAERTERQNTEHENQCKSSGGEWEEETNKCNCSDDLDLTKQNDYKCKCKENGHEWSENDGQCIQTARAQNRAERTERQNTESDKTPGQLSCERFNGEWRNNKCKNAQCPDNKVWSNSSYTCLDKSPEQLRCEGKSGTWDNDKNKCSNARCDEGERWDNTENDCVQTARTQKRAERTERQNTEHENQCKSSGGEWNETENKCSCTGMLQNKNNNECKCMFNNMTYDNTTKECVSNKQNKPEQTNAPEQTQEQINEQIRNTAYNASVPTEITIKECRDGNSYTIEAGQSPQAAGVPRECWEEAKRFVGVKIS